MSQYGAITSGADNDYAELRRYINRQLIEKDVTIKTALKATAFLNDLNEKSSKKSGLDFELPNYKIEIRKAVGIVSTRFAI